MCASPAAEEAVPRPVERVRYLLKGRHSHPRTVYLTVDVRIVEQVIAVELVECEREDLLEYVP